MSVALISITIPAMLVTSMNQNGMRRKVAFFLRPRIIHIAMPSIASAATSWFDAPKTGQMTCHAGIGFPSGPLALT